jgi:glutaredoxin-like protein NrdH
MKKVTVYELPACVQCRQTKMVLDRAGVIYETIDLSQNKKAMAHVTALGYTQAPVVETQTAHWSGFRLKFLENLILQIHGEEAKQ